MQKARLSFDNSRYLCIGFTSAYCLKVKLTNLGMLWINKFDDQDIGITSPTD